jgi:hypothetical protein
MLPGQFLFIPCSDLEVPVKLHETFFCGKSGVGQRSYPKTNKMNYFLELEPNPTGPRPTVMQKHFSIRSEVKEYQNPKRDYLEYPISADDNKRPSANIE